MKEKRSLLDKASTDTLTAQIELDRTAELFRQTHRDRESMIEQWEETIGQMKKRDSEIDHAANVSVLSPAEGTVTDIFVS